MMNVCFNEIQSVLCLGAHSDDIEIGCGGAILQLIRKRPELRIDWVVLSGSGVREDEARASASSFLSGCQNTSVQIHQFRDAYFPAQWQAIKHQFSTLAERCDPDVIFTHRLDDRHQDHQIVSQLTWNHFRSHSILEYEIPKYEGDLATPTVYVPLQPETVSQKIELLTEHFPSQASRPWFDRATFEGIMRIRGLESGTDSSWAEGFHTRKIAIEF